MDLSAQNKKWILNNARTHQRWMRFTTLGSFSYPVIAFVGLLYGVLPFSVPIAALCGAMLVYHFHHQRYGERQNWWWLRRGPVVPLEDFSRIEDARAWLKTGGLDYAEITPGGFKFYKASDAVHFKLVWC